jgi:hypothetical protein
MSVFTAYYGGGTPVSIVNWGSEVAQIIELSTGAVPTSTQVAGWESYLQGGGSLSSVASAFVSSTAFANMYDGGHLVDPNAAASAPITSAIIDHIFGSHTDAQVAAWVGTGLSTAQVFQSFALGEQFTELEAAPNAGFTSWGNLTLTGSETVNFTSQSSQIIIESGDVTGATTSGGTSTSGISIPTLSGDTAGVEIDFGNAPTEIFAGQVDVSSAGSLAQALDIAAAAASASEPGGSVPADTGILDWFQFGGNTYVVEAINPTPYAAEQTALTATDAVVGIVGSVDLDVSNIMWGTPPFSLGLLTV